MLWSTHKRGDPQAIAHKMVDDTTGRPMSPVCGRTTHGLWLRAFTRWESVPEHQRCPDCERDTAPADGNRGSLAGAGQALPR